MVFSTLHTLDAMETIQRIIAVFPPPEQKQIRLQLAGTLKAIISQRLVRTFDGIGRVPAVEVLIATAYIRDCIINPGQDPPDPRRHRRRHFASTACRRSTSRSTTCTRAS